ncbi:Elongation factor 2 [Orbilia ellipsospora]|uniref:Elongation factor 2 n=1 Tax=Orbilia ellipsospora TaxID=2528407 RepID=A0AAV9X7C8_9PEZI
MLVLGNRHRFIVLGSVMKRKYKLERPSAKSNIPDPSKYAEGGFDPEILGTSKSANGLNRIFIEALCLDWETAYAIPKGEINTSPDADLKERYYFLAERCTWKGTDARNIWAFGGKGNSNVLVNLCKSIDNLDRVKDAIIAGFQQAVKQSPVTGLPIVNTRFNIVDMKLAENAADFGDDQMTTLGLRGVYAAFMASTPRLQEAIYEDDTFIGWDNIGSARFPFDSSTRAGKLAAELRQKNGLSGDPPNLATYMDKL